MRLPEIPRTWIIFCLLGALITMRVYGIDSWTTASISTIIGYITGKHLEQIRQAKTKKPSS